MSAFAIQPEALRDLVAAALGDQVRSVTIKLGEVTVEVASSNYLEVMRKLRDTARYKAEKVKQEPLFREERRQKRQRKMEQSEQRKREQAAKKRAERAAKAEWAAKKKAEAEAKALTLAETSAEAALDTISAAINPSQAETV